ncbi:MAG: hypothetical protein BGO28_03900 [Alphaproteobacteria bacterium 43-37]|nr:MAG: hypothetical protein BGO28_03900 [Alphaproteobacteria bacterium 43-37]
MIRSLASLMIVQVSIGLAYDSFAETPRPSSVFNDGQPVINVVHSISAAQDPLSPPKIDRSPLEGSQDPSKQVIMAILAAVSQKQVSMGSHSHSKGSMREAKESKQISK